MDIINIFSINRIKINNNNNHKIKTPFNPVFVILLIVNYFEVSPKYSESSFISEFFTLN